MLFPSPTSPIVVLLLVTIHLKQLVNIQNLDSRSEQQSNANRLWLYLFYIDVDSYFCKCCFSIDQNLKILNAMSKKQVAAKHVTRPCHRICALFEHKIMVWRTQYRRTPILIDSISIKQLIYKYLELKSIGKMITTQGWLYFPFFYMLQRSLSSLGNWSRYLFFVVRILLTY